MHKKNWSSVLIRSAVFIILSGAFCFVIWVCFRQLLKPRSDLNNRTLFEITNSYQDDASQKGSIYDCNGTILMANVVLDNKQPVMVNDSYQLVKDLDPIAQKQADIKRMLLNEQVPGCFSNILPIQSDGLDYYFSDILQDIPLTEEEDTNITLTIDGNVQAQTSQIMSAERNISSAVVMDCNSGDILAMVSTPSYDYNAFTDAAYVPYSGYEVHGYFYNNVNNSYDCVQDYYKEWKNLWEEDNKQTEDISEWTAGAGIRNWEGKLRENSLWYSDKEEVQLVIDYWNSHYEVQYDLRDCIEIDFREIYRQEREFYEDEQNEGRYFSFTFEPEKLGSGADYVPFFKAIASDGTEGYFKLCYGNNNFIYTDCEAYHFDPNFSLENCARTTSAPGSCFKILMSALLLDKASYSLIRNGDLYIGNQYYSSAPAYLPTVETAKQSHSTLKAALSSSSNQYFSMAAIALDPILKLQTDSYAVDLDTIENMDVDSVRSSARILQDYYEAKFNINTRIDSYFRVPEGQILSSLNIMQIMPEPGENHYIYDNSLWYTLGDKDEVIEAFTGSKASLMKKIGDTAYGQGYDRISPLYMALSIGKCITGKMYIPNVLADDSAPRSFGEDFDRDQDTVNLMREHLKQVYNDHPGYLPENLSFTADGPEKDFQFYSKTGTSSVDRGTGTQSTYGVFADFAGYPVLDGSKYQIIWYVGAVSDGNHCYAIVLRSYFENSRSSYSLKNEFLQIVQSLYDNDYLKD